MNSEISESVEKLKFVDPMPGIFRKGVLQWGRASEKKGRFNETSDSEEHSESGKGDDMDDSGQYRRCHG